MVRACRPAAREPASSWLARRSTMATSARARASSPASISPVGPPPAITTACSLIVTPVFHRFCPFPMRFDRCRYPSMSWQPCDDPQPGDRRACELIDTVIVPRARDLGGFSVRRALPSPDRQMVGPFIFFDQMGPAEFLLGEGMDVRPHPHIGLSTVTYLFAGEVMHRDSLGTALAIRPGELSWMTAGRGIVHSERTAA